MVPGVDGSGRPDLKVPGHLVVSPKVAFSSDGRPALQEGGRLASLTLVPGAEPTVAYASHPGHVVIGFRGGAIEYDAAPPGYAVLGGDELIAKDTLAAVSFGPPAAPEHRSPTDHIPAPQTDPEQSSWDRAVAFIGKGIADPAPLAAVIRYAEGHGRAEDEELVRTGLSGLPDALGQIRRSTFLTGAQLASYRRIAGDRVLLPQHGPWSGRALADVNDPGHTVFLNIHSRSGKQVGRLLTGEPGADAVLFAPGARFAVTLVQDLNDGTTAVAVHEIRSDLVETYRSEPAAEHVDSTPVSVPVLRVVAPSDPPKGNPADRTTPSSADRPAKSPLVPTRKVMSRTRVVPPLFPSAPEADARTARTLLMRLSGDHGGSSHRLRQQRSLDEAVRRVLDLPAKVRVTATDRERVLQFADSILTAHPHEDLTWERLAVARHLGDIARLPQFRGSAALRKVAAGLHPAMDANRLFLTAEALAEVGHPITRANLRKVAMLVHPGPPAAKPSPTGWALTALMEAARKSVGPAPGTSAVHLGTAAPRGDVGAEGPPQPETMPAIATDRTAGIPRLGSVHSFHPQYAETPAEMFAGVRFVEISPHYAEQQLGIPLANQAKFQTKADEHGAVIEVRPTNPASVPHLKRGALPKPEAIKAKSISEEDVGSERDRRRSGWSAFSSRPYPSETQRSTRSQASGSASLTVFTSEPGSTPNSSRRWTTWPCRTGSVWCTEWWRAGTPPAPGARSPVTTTSSTCTTRTASGSTRTHTRA